MTAPDAEARIRAALKPSEEGAAGLDEVDEVLSLVTAQIPADRIEFTPRLVRGLSYYTGPIWEVVADGVPGSISSGGRYDHLIEQLGGPDVPGTGGSLGIERILLLLPDGARRAAPGGWTWPSPSWAEEFEPRELRACRGRAPGRACGPASTWARPGSSAASSSGPATRAPAGR